MLYLNNPTKRSQEMLQSILIPATYSNAYDILIWFLNYACSVIFINYCLWKLYQKPTCSPNKYMFDYLREVSQCYQSEPKLKKRKFLITYCWTSK